jgi:DNA-binding beta-propeller fold protein YncE
VNVGAHRSVSRGLVRLWSVLAAGRGDVGEPLLRRMPTALALSVAVVFALCAGAAQAEPPKLVFDGKFQTQYPLGVAVDQQSSDVYVAALALGNINKFDASGKLISPPSPFGSGSGFYSGVAVNPTNGDLYVVDAAAQAIDIYESNGTLLSSFGASGCANGFSGSFTWSQLATDFAGNVYLACAPENAVREYNPGGTLINTFTGSGGSGLEAPTGVAVDPTGNVWVADDGNGRIEEFNGSGSLVGAFRSEGVEALAVDTRDHVYAVVRNGADLCGSLGSPCTHVVEYSASGAQLADVGAGELERGYQGAPNTLAVDDATGRVYVTDNTDGIVWLYAPPAAPAIQNELSAEVTTSEAKLGALVVPGGIATSYRFESGTTTAYGNAAPFPEGDAGDGVTPHTVWAALGGLAPGATYHYRVIVTNELGTIAGPDQTFTTETAGEASCPNEQMRSGFSASLPDCRAYELVTPPNGAAAEPDTEHGAEDFEPGGGATGNVAARTGERLAYRSSEVMPGAGSSGYDYLATRGAGGWSSEDLIPLQSYDGDRCSVPLPRSWATGDEVDAYSPDLIDSVLRVGGGQSWGKTAFTGGCGAQGLEIVEGEPLGVENLLLRDNATGAYRLIDTPPAGVTPTDAHFKGASADFSHVIFSETARLTENAPAGVEDLYEWDKGLLRLVTILPDGTPVAGSLAPDPTAVASRSSTVSAEGARAFFTANGNLYVRINGDETAQLDAPRGGSGPGGGGSFQIASADGTQAFFTDEASAGLTSDTSAGSGENLYRYANGELTDLTPAEHAEVVSVSGISKDGSYVYFVADGVLSGAQTNERGQTAQAGQANLYLWHAGTTIFIATLTVKDDTVANGAARVSANGAFLAFSSVASLTGYDNIDASTGEHDSEIFLYSATSGQLVCVSCNPSGEPPSAGKHAWGGATLAARNGSPGNGTPHYLTDSGHVFFETQEALLPSDTNGQIDVYEYENGQLKLISPGTGSTQAVLLDVSESGSDVFFLGRQSLVAQDSATEALVIYDARVDGGFAAISSPPACTTADACRTPVSPQPSLYGAPSSQTFSGAGNVTPPAEVKPKKKAKPKKKPNKQACKRNKHKRARCAARARRAGSNAKSHKGGK